MGTCRRIVHVGLYSLLGVGNSRVLRAGQCMDLIFAMGHVDVE